ncbi:signal-transduction and transcriptional-control protein Stc [Thermacetogenium phaeum DSM 12270]|uniref:Signal-transduction and transcriptional-control protein Stc n=1 Tax=Thermacetogenium phaeum (strain ATCC BAA-254 / DSM 26808 / PB) TaxID=1089553 RepID=K4LF56_THEPS|nr:sigma 54-interacting transcriptional regulator [Thermacetogenium phaeum]AFV10625.1 signal-transduction and transcriptional-control protein Stc [Thermacetogenium phaeum DSM 12270]
MIILDSGYRQYELDQSDIVNVWRRFIDGGNEKSSLLPSTLLSSWKRCFELKVDPLMSDLDLTVVGDFAKRIETKEWLLNLAASHIAKYYKLAEQSDFVFAILDEDGVILDLIGEQNRVRRLEEEYSITHGVPINERTTGTTATYLSLLSNKSVQTVGAEHYIRRFHHITDSAAPIRDARGNIIGALSMSAQNIEYAHPHTLGMVTSIADSIAVHLRRQEVEKNQELFEGSLDEVVDNLCARGLLQIDEWGRAERVSRPLAELLGLPPERLVGLPADVVARLGAEKIPFRGRQAGRRMIAAPDGSRKPGKVAGAIISDREVPEKKGKSRKARNRFGFEDIVGRSRQLLKAVDLAKKIANSTSAVLLLGESGTGKELFARAIHNSSPMSEGPFVSVNCAAIPRELVGTELFGYEEGAFTGAKKGGNVGKFELANNGTLFLDEIGEMPLEIQGYLLRALEEKAITRIGGNCSIPVNVRVIAATNRRLREDALAGHFRLDLFFRLNVFTISLPPLRERPDDIPLLVDHFISKFSAASGKNVLGVTPAAMEALRRYRWPGNVRELSNVIERAVFLSESQYIDVSDLPEEIVGCDGEDGVLTVKDYERIKISELLSKFKGNKTRVAATLGISRASLYRRLKEYGMM